MQIYTLRNVRHQQWLGIVFEWEDVIAQATGTI